MDFPKLHIRKALFKSGEEAEFGPDDIVIMTGPNNSGKTQFLTDIYNCIRGDHEKDLQVIASVEMEKDFTPDELIAFLNERFPKALIQMTLLQYSRRSSTKAI